MSKDATKKIGLIVGPETDWPDAFIQVVNEREGYRAELVKLGATSMEDPIDYAVIIDRFSHETPYYRAYLKYATIQGCYIINNPFTWSADSKFFGTALVNKMGLTSPRTAILPNKEIELETGPESFRNLKYPMDWEAIIEYVGVPAIFKDIHSGGRRPAYRVSSVDELLQRYDESGTRTKILQQVIDSDIHIHCFVIGQENVLPLRYTMQEGRYLPETMSTDDPLTQQLIDNALTLTKAYRYDVNMVEFVIKDDITYVINSTNPTPAMDKELMTDEQFNWCLQKTVDVAIQRAESNSSQIQLLANINDLTGG